MADPEKIHTMPKYDLSVYPNLLKAAELLDESNYTQEQPLNPSAVVFQDKPPFEYIKGFWLLSLSKSPIFNLPTCSSLKMFLMPLNVAPSGI